MRRDLRLLDTRARIRADSVLVVHPGRQHAYETAVAVQKAGHLRAFVTSLYFAGKGLISKRALRFAPTSLREAFAQRSHPELDPGRVITIPQYQAISEASERLLPPGSLRRLAIEDWAQERFDSTVSRLLRRLEIRVVHVFEGGSLATLREARRLGIRTVLDVPSAHEYYRRVAREEGGDDRNFPTDRVHAERELADYLLTPSAFVDRCLLENGVPPEKILRIPYGVSPTSFVPSTRTDNLFRVLFVGHIGLRKGIKYLLEAWRLLNLKNAELIIIGESDNFGTDILRHYPRQSRYIGSVSRNELWRWYSLSDVFAFPTLAEGSALVSYEAMASGLPVITTPNCGSVLRDGIHGFLVEPRDVGALREKIRLFYEFPALRAEMGARARRLIETQYTWQHYHERVGSVHRALLAGRDPPITEERLMSSDSPANTPGGGSANRLVDKDPRATYGTP